MSLATGTVEVWGPPEGLMPPGARWCDRPDRGEGVVFHCDPQQIDERTDEWYCALCGARTWDTGVVH